MLYKTKVGVCSEIHAKHINAMWASSRIFEYYTWWCVKLPLGFKMLNYFLLKRLSVGFANKQKKNPNFPTANEVPCGQPAVTDCLFSQLH
jgi:hypothetical protein